MTKTGTAIEKNPEVLPVEPDVEVVPAEAVTVDTSRNLDVLRAQEARTQRVEVANRVLSLLGSLGNLALRIVELRGSSSSAPVQSAPRVSSAAPQVTRPESRVAGAPRSGGRGRQQRRRHRGRA